MSVTFERHDPINIDGIVWYVRRMTKYGFTQAQVVVSGMELWRQPSRAARRAMIRARFRNAFRTLRNMASA